MKAVQVMLDEALLAELDASDAVAREGPSAIIRRAVADDLARQREVEICEAYDVREGLTDPGKGSGPELAGWEEQGAWPDE